MCFTAAIAIDRLLVFPSAEGNELTRVFPAAQKLLTLTPWLFDQKLSAVLAPEPFGFG
jgi:hypothetical protein